MDRSDFIHSSAILRVSEKKFLSRSMFNRMIDTENLEEALKVLNVSSYQANILKLSRKENFKEALLKEKKEVFETAYKMSPDPKIVDLVVLKYHYHNLKVLVKEQILDGNFSDMYIEIGEFSLKELKEQLENDRAYSRKEFFDTVKMAKAIYDQTKDPQEIELLIDKMYFKKLKDTAKELEVEFFDRYVEDLIDFTNINILLRCNKQKREFEFLKNALIDGGSIEKNRYLEYLNSTIKENSPLFRMSRIYKSVRTAIIEYNKSDSLLRYGREKDNYFIGLIKEVKKITYGPEVIFAYLLAKEIEIKNLRIVLISKLNGMDPSFIRERLRDNYV